MMHVIQDNPNLEDSFNREREQQMIDALGQQQENPPNVFENNHSQSSSNYDDAAMNNNDQQRLEDIQQLNQLIQDQTNMLLSGTFNARSNPLNNLQIVAGRGGDGEEEAKIFSNQTMEDERSPANNIFSPENQEHRRRRTSEDEDEEADAEQLKRIERILKDQRKQ